MRVGFSALFDSARSTGAGLATYRLVESLAAQHPDDLFVLFVRRRAVGMVAAHPNLRFEVCGPLLRGRSVGRLLEQTVLPFYAATMKLDLIHSTNGVVPLAAPCPVVLTLLDLTYHHLVDHRFDRRKTLWYRAMVRPSTRRSAAIIVPSTTVAADVVSVLGVAPRRLRVIPLAPNPLPPAAPEFVHHQPYLLMVGEQEPIKDHITAISALSLLPDTDLIIVGPEGRSTAAIRSRARELGIAHRVRFAGYVDAWTLAGLYKGAVALVWASWAEGFGLPPLEAMTLGCPVVSTSTAPMPEVLGDDALYFPVGDALTLADRVSTLVRDRALRPTMVVRGRRRAALFTWQRTAARTYEVYESVL